MSKPLPNDPPDIVANARPLREQKRPFECNGDPRCWVEIGRRGLQKSSANTVTPQCVACRGHIFGIYVVDKSAHIRSTCARG